MAILWVIRIAGEAASLVKIPLSFTRKPVENPFHFTYVLPWLQPAVAYKNASGTIPEILGNGSYSTSGEHDASSGKKNETWQIPDNVRLLLLWAPRDPKF